MSCLRNIRTFLVFWLLSFVYGFRQVTGRDVEGIFQKLCLWEGRGREREVGGTAPGVSDR